MLFSLIGCSREFHLQTQTYFPPVRKEGQCPYSLHLMLAVLLTLSVPDMLERALGSPWPFTPNAF